MKSIQEFKLEITRRINTAKQMVAVTAVSDEGPVGGHVTESTSEPNQPTPAKHPWKNAVTPESLRKGEEADAEKQRIKVKKLADKRKIQEMKEKQATWQAEIRNHKFLEKS
ncbi:hypothetical protein PSHT_13656 [Puccinia striiformis]|uniref:Uncharacterized protein n=1 Tax=Puccinia striiformis TaxID=27350 RepID=A0A2S4UPW5_9BASI|nr:hypothetical protein PSHT_13656 [Puccinia striiformis]